MTLLEMLNAVMSESSFLTRTSWASSNDPDAKQVVAIANRVAYEMYNWVPWPEMRETATVTLTTATSYALPSDHQSIIPDSAWETDGSRKVDLPVPDGEWFMYKFSSLTTAGTIRAKIVGSNLEVIDPVEGQEFSYRYISKYPVLSSALVRKEKFTNDTDTFVLDDMVFILGVQAHWQQAKRMPNYLEFMQNYMSKMAEAYGRSMGAQKIGCRGTTVARRAPYYPLYRT